jgi:hypothetical protein
MLMIKLHIILIFFKLIGKEQRGINIINNNYININKNYKNNKSYFKNKDFMSKI